jgi:ribosomal small subunit protein bTHX
MGSGDIRTRRGKIWAGSYGNSRPHKKKKPVPKPGALPKPGGSR